MIVLSLDKSHQDDLKKISILKKKYTGNVFVCLFLLYLFPEQKLHILYYLLSKFNFFSKWQADGLLRDKFNQEKDLWF